MDNQGFPATSSYGALIGALLCGEISLRSTLFILMNEGENLLKILKRSSRLGHYYILLFFCVQSTHIRCYWSLGLAAQVSQMICRKHHKVVGEGSDQNLHMQFIVQHKSILNYCFTFNRKMSASKQHH